jgi:hypothetical protein
MQAITIAIGKAGVNFFAQQYLGDNLTNTLGKLKPPDNTISVANFEWSPDTDTSWSYSDISIELTDGALENFAPTYQGVVQGVTSDSKETPIFTLTIVANDFSVSYSWTENYQYVHDWTTWVGRIPTHHHKSGSASTPLSYSPSFESLTITPIVQFLYSSANNAWEISVSSISTQPSGEAANIPTASILQHQDNSCFSSTVSSATAQSLEDINFVQAINGLITGILATIPASGDLGSGIVYDFSLGDSGLLFPNNDGIQMGVKGGATYNGTSFSGSNPPSLPLPAPLADSDTHHLNMYVSNYEVDALNWAYYEAGNLNLIITQEDLEEYDPDALKVSTYTTLEPSLNPYAGCVMQAQVAQNAAPVSSFQTVYVYTADVMALLQKQLPANIYQLLQALLGNAYLTQADVDNFLTSATVPQTYFAQIEDAGKTTAMVVTQDMDFTLVIQTGDPQQPYIKFNVQRADVLTALQLGPSKNNTQALQYSFTNATNTATYISSSIAGFNGAIFGTVVWPIVAEPLYEEALQAQGNTGVPLPIMQGFRFLFDQAEISVQQGYVSILADVEFVTEAAVKAAY